MRLKRHAGVVTGALGLGLSLAAAGYAPAYANGYGHQNIQHVLLTSIDGFHALDYTNCAQGISTVNGGKPYCPNLASLGLTGVNYVTASTSKPSDSFPGLMSIMTGATPRTMGIYYDVAYDRVYAPPLNTTGNGLSGGLVRLTRTMAPAPSMRRGSISTRLSSTAARPQALTGHPVDRQHPAGTRSVQ